MADPTVVYETHPKDARQHRYLVQWFQLGDWNTVDQTYRTRLFASERADSFGRVGYEARVIDARKVNSHD